MSSRTHPSFPRFRAPPLKTLRVSYVRQVRNQGIPSQAGTAIARASWDGQNLHDQGASVSHWAERRQRAPGPHQN